MPWAFLLFVAFSRGSAQILWGIEGWNTNGEGSRVYGVNVFFLIVDAGFLGGNYQLGVN